MNYSREGPAVLWISALDHTLAGCGLKKKNVCKCLVLSPFPAGKVNALLLPGMLYPVSSCPISLPSFSININGKSIFPFLRRWGPNQLPNKWKQNICAVWKGGWLSLEIFINWLNQGTANPLSCTSDVTLTKRD